MKFQINRSVHVWVICYMCQGLIKETNVGDESDKTMYPVTL